MSSVGMELSVETSFVSRRRGMISLSCRPLSVHIWTSLLQSRSVRWESVSRSGSQRSGARWETRGCLRVKWFKKKRSWRLKTVFFTHSLPLFSVLTLLWKGLTNEGGTVSDASQKTQPRLWFEAQTWTGANLQHNTLQSTSLRLVCVSVWRCTVHVCLGVAPYQPLSLLLFVSVCRWKLPGQTSQLRDGGSGQAVRLLLLQERLLCLVHPECPAC